MEPWTWEVLAVLTAAVLVNSFGFMAWKSDVVGDWGGDVNDDSGTIAVFMTWLYDHDAGLGVRFSPMGSSAPGARTK